MMDSNDIKELMGDFLIETKEIIESLDHDLVELEHKQTDLDLLNKIFRGAHTMKGSSSFLGFEKLANVTHHAEEILNKLRKNELLVTEGIMDILLEFVDVTKGLISDIQTGVDSTNTEIIIDKLKLANEGKEVARQSPNVPSSPQAGAPQQAIPPKPTPAAPPKTPVALPQQEQTIRVDVSRLDILLNLVGELVLSRNRLSQLSSDLEKKFDNEYLIDQLAEATSAIGMNTTELQIAVMKTRMIPIGKVFSKFPRMIRDLSRDSGKEIDLIISGEDTELDKSVVEEIGDPLIHLIRNSCDHGCEIPEKRELLGKPRRGVINLKAYHEGNHIVIEIKDDGAGMDPNKLKAKAIEKKIITVEEAASMSEEQAYALIFKPGFSTAETVTNVSGRGVGMDVVRTNVEKLNGIISVSSEVGGGSTFYLKLPLTLAIIQALLVEVSGESFAIPLVSVIETVKVSLKNVHSFEGREILKLRDRVLSLFRLDHAFELEYSDKEEMYIVIVGVAEKQVGFIVDNLIGQEEIVIKSLGEYISNNSSIAGATITGDGRVRLIIDVAGVIELMQNTPKRIVKKPSTNKDENIDVNHSISVLVCDDSVMDRKIVRKILESTRKISIKEVSSAKDAITALEKNPNSYDLLISDIMMPDMDGFQLALTLRNKGINIPILAMSARSEVSDRKKIAESGITDFIIKPLSQYYFIDKVETLVSQKTTKN